MSYKPFIYSLAIISVALLTFVLITQDRLCELHITGVDIKVMALLDCKS